MDFEVDYKTVVDSIYGKHNGVSDFAIIINYCRRLLGTNFMNSDVKFIRRKARVAPSLSNFHIFSSIPTCILAIILNEMDEINK